MTAGTVWSLHWRRNDLLAQHAAIFVERVNKSTDNRPSRCFATTTDAHPCFGGDGDHSRLATGARAGDYHPLTPLIEFDMGSMNCPICVPMQSKLTPQLTARALIAQSAANTISKAPVIAREQLQSLDPPERCAWHGEAFSTAGYWSFEHNLLARFCRSAAAGSVGSMPGRNWHRAGD
jgi:hypothetical protein